MCALLMIHNTTQSSAYKLPNIYAVLIDSTSELIYGMFYDVSTQVLRGDEHYRMETGAESASKKKQQMPQRLVTCV